MLTRGHKTFSEYKIKHDMDMYTEKVRLEVERLAWAMCEAAGQPPAL